MKKTRRNNNCPVSRERLVPTSCFHADRDAQLFIQLCFFSMGPLQPKRHPGHKSSSSNASLSLAAFLHDPHSNCELCRINASTLGRDASSF